MLEVLVGQAADPATAKAEWSAALEQAEAKINGDLPAGVHVSFDASNTSGIGDAALTLSGTDAAAGISFNGIYVLSGATFFLLGDLVLNRAPASIADLTTQAQTSLSRI